MKCQKQLKVSISLIQGLLARDGWEPKQRNALERTLKNLRLLRRLNRKEQTKGLVLLREIIEDWESTSTEMYRLHSSRVRFSCIVLCVGVVNRVLDMPAVCVLRTSPQSAVCQTLR